MRRRKVPVHVNDLMQTGYVYYLTEAAGKNFHPDFKPELTPKEMLELGVFGGEYLTDCRKEFPLRGSNARSSATKSTTRNSTSSK